ncbi:MAG: PQ-loop domain-containing transporter [Minisyncoccota bacterium]
MRHLHIRKRVSKSLEPYPARTVGKRVLDGAVYAVGTLGPVMTLPQIILIYSTQEAAGISLITWLTWALFDIPWILYGFVHREMPIAVTYSLWFVANLTVALGAVLYG